VPEVGSELVKGERLKAKGEKEVQGARFKV
jgi:hypothetical protein